MLIPRRITVLLQDLGTFFPILSLTGPRQAGKTTLLRHLYPGYRYVSLENPTTLSQALDDPEGFLREYDDRVIFDEAQRFPELFSYLQEVVDLDRRPGRFVLSGSQNFLLRKNISQSLAGRVGVAKLLPLDIAEMRRAGLLPESAWEAVYRGAYPELIERGYRATRFYDSYLQTYLQRDVTELINFGNLRTFERFLRICATFAGQAINLSKIAKEAGISVPTVRSWLGILEQSYVLFQLSPYHRNRGKRLTKTPKLYFYDTGLACHLLGFTAPEELPQYDRKGALFENMIVADAHKSCLHQGRPLRFTFYRDSRKNEVDLVYETALEASLWEIKSGRRFRDGMTTVLDRVAASWDRPTRQYLIYRGEDEVLKGKTQLVNWGRVEWGGGVS